MTSRTSQELPFQFALAEAFTICDAYFCGLHTSTNPNRLIAFTGTNRLPGRPAVIDNDHDTLGDPAAGYTWSTYAERLEAAGVSWKVYQDMDDNFTDNPLVGFKSFREAAERDPASPLVTKGLSTTLTNADLEGLRRDVLDGSLPSVSWIIGPADYSEHPGPSSPVQGAFYVQQVLEALTADPAVFSRTVLLVTFDENDGFFDHVPPPCAPSGVGDGTLAGASTADDTGERFDDAGDPLFGPRPLGPGPRAVVGDELHAAAGRVVGDLELERLARRRRPDLRPHAGRLQRRAADAARGRPRRPRVRELRRRGQRPLVRRHRHGRRRPRVPPPRRRPHGDRRGLDQRPRVRRAQLTPAKNRRRSTIGA